MIVNNRVIEKEYTFAELASILGFSSLDEEADLNIEHLDLGVETPNGFSIITEFYVKKKTMGYQLGNLRASGDHKTLVGGEWIRLRDNPAATCLNEDIEVVDLCVPDGNCYIANGHINHNTTPGGWY